MKKHIDYPARTLVVRLLATTAIMVCGLSGFNACAAMIATHTTIAAADTTYDGQDIVVSNCTLTVNGPHTFASLVLTNNALLTHTPAPNGETNNRLLLSITGDATIAAGCQVDVAGRGYGAGTGPGAGIVAYNGGSGGAIRQRGRPR